MEKIMMKHKILLLAGGILITLSLRPFIARQNCNRGDSFLRLGFNSQAVRQYKKAIILAPEFTYAYNQLGLAYEGTGRIEDAIVVFNKSFKINPENEEGYLQLGRIYGNRKAYEKAEIYFKKALELNPKNIIASIWLDVCSKVREKNL